MVLEEICDVSARLCVNRVSLKLKAQAIGAVLQQLRDALKEGRQA